MTYFIFHESVYEQQREKRLKKRSSQQQPEESESIEPVQMDQSSESQSDPGKKNQTCIS